MKSAAFRAMMQERRKARSPRDKQPYFGPRKLDALCLRKRCNGIVRVMCDETWILE